MREASTTHSRGDFSGDERVEIREVLFSRRFRKWLLGRLKVWVGYITVVGGASLAAIHWVNDFVPSVIKMLRVFGLGSP